ncbi:MAG: tetratricopeptide repeat protein [bacterium]
MIKKLIDRKTFPALLLILMIGLMTTLLCHHDSWSAQRSRQSDRHSGKKSSKTEKSGRSSRPGRSRSASAQNRSAYKDDSLKDSPPVNNNFSQGVREFHRGSYSPARRYLEAARSENPELMDYVLYYLARSLEELGDREQAIATFEKLLAQYPQSRFTPKATLKVADIYFFLRQYDKARVYYQKSLDLVPDKKEYILFQTALSLIDEKKWTETRDILKKILVQFPGGEYARLSIMCNQELEKEYHLPPLTFSEEDRMEMIQAQIRGRCYEEALRRIAEFRKQPSLSPGCRAHLLFQEASCHTKLGNKDQALETLRRMVRLYPGSDDAAEALLLIGNTLWNQDRDAEAIDAYEKVVKDFPRRAGAADKAWYMIGRIHEQNRNYPKAIASFESLVRNFPKSSYYPESLWRIGWGYYQQGKYQEARQRFKDGLTKVEEHQDKHQLLYWQARAAEKSQDSPAALSLYQTIANDGYYSYYTWWAQQRVEKWNAPALLDSFPGQVEITGVSYSEDVRFHLVRARKLLEYGLKEEASGEIGILVEAQESDPGYWYNLSKLARRAGMNREAVLAGSRCQQSLARQGRSESYADVLELLYPLIYWDSIERHAGRYGLDPLIVCALMRQESMFDPLSLSSARAYGLMQIIPSTARMIASRINAFGGQNFEVEQLYEPDVNIAFGCWYLADLLQRFDGNLVYTLISYNAGEETLKRWRNQYNTVNLDEFVEMLSYKETRNYVKKVLKNYGCYMRLYSGKSASSPTSPAAPKQVNRQDSQARGTSGPTGLNQGGEG